MNILDICAKSRSINGGLMKISDIVAFYNKKSQNQISKFLFIFFHFNN